MALARGHGSRQLGWDTGCPRTYLWFAVTSLAFDSGAIASTVRRAVEGDEVAFARLVDAYHLDLVRVAFVVCGDAGMAEDAAQSAWWIAWRKLRGVREPERIKAWLVAIAANEARKLVKRAHAAGVVEIPMGPRDDLRPGPTADDPAGVIGELDLDRALRRLNPEDRVLIALRYITDLDSNELGAALGMSASGVRSRLQRVLQRLRKDLRRD